MFLLLAFQELGVGKLRGSIGSRVILAKGQEWFMDEFAHLEMELNLDSRTLDLEELVLDIEGSIIEADIFFKRKVRNFPSQLKYTLMVLGIVTLPLLGLGVLFILMSLSNGPINEDTVVVKATAYVKEHRLLTEYVMHNSTVKSAKMFPLLDASYLTMNTSYGGEYQDTTYHSYVVHSGPHHYEILYYQKKYKLSDTTRKQIKAIYDFADMAGLSFQKPD